MAIGLGMKNLEKTRWISLIAMMLIMTTLSIGYTWSLLVDPVINEWGGTNEFMAATYSALTVTGAIFTLVGGKMVEKIGSRLTNIICLLLYLVGMVATGLTQNLMVFAVSQAILIGFGQSVIYIAVFNSANSIFPDHRGLATGLASAGISLGGMVISPICQAVIDSFGFANQFTIMGIALAAYGIVACFLIPDVPKGWKPASFDPNAEGGKKATKVSHLKPNPDFVQKDWKGMLKDPAFYILFIIPLLCSTGYMLLAYQMSYIAQDILSIDPMQAAFLVSGVAAMGFAAKIIGGFVGDRVGRLLWVSLVLVFGTLCIGGLIFSADHGFTWFAACSLGYCFCMGTFAGATGAITGDLFGSEHFGFNFSIVYMSVLAASAISPWLAVVGRTAGDAPNYGPIFMLCTAMCAAGTILMFVLYFMRRNKTEYLFRTKEEMAEARAELTASAE